MEAERYVPVACLGCGRPFQAQHDKLGQTVVCPWCRAATPALPIATANIPAPGESSASAPVSSAPSLLSTEGPASAKESPGPAAAPVTPRKEAPASHLPSQPSIEAGPERGGFSTPPPPPDVTPASTTGSRWQVTAILLGVFLIASVTLIVLRFRQGYGISAEWRPIVLSDGQVQIDLLSTPWEETDSHGVRRVWSRGWYSGAYAWSGWQDLTDQQVQAARAPDARHKLDGLIQRELEQWQRRFGGNGRTATVQFTEPLIVEIKWEADNVRGLGRVVVVSQGPNPRVYYLGIAAPHLVYDSAAVRHFLDSFRYTPES